MSKFFKHIIDTSCFNEINHIFDFPAAWNRNMAIVDKCLYKFCLVQVMGLFVSTIAAAALMTETDMILNYIVAIGNIFQLSILCGMGVVVEISV